MKKEVALVALAVLLAPGWLFGQDRNRRLGGWNGAGRFFPFFAAPAPRFPLFSPFFGIFSSSRFPGRDGSVLFAERWLGRAPSWTWSGGSSPFPGYAWHPAPYWGADGYGGEWRADPAGRRGFVEEWKNRDPFRAEGRREIRSIVLSEGLSEDEVVARIGSPLQRIELGDREVWRYSGYSLLFEKGLLTEIR